MVKAYHLGRRSASLTSYSLSSAHFCCHFFSISPGLYLATINLPCLSELPPSKLGGICGANSHTFFARIRFAAPKDAACHPALRFIPAASCGVFSLAFIKVLRLQDVTSEEPHYQIMVKLGVQKAALLNSPLA